MTDQQLSKNARIRSELGEYKWNSWAIDKLNKSID